MYKLDDLKYPYDALEPIIDKQTMELHHGKHHQAYVNNLNNAIEGLDLKANTIEELLKDLMQIPEAKRQAVINNGGGHYNHTLFWESMTPGGAKEPQGDLKKAIDETFGDFEKMKDLFEKAGAGQFGSGWAWLVLEDGKLKITSTANQDAPISKGQIPLLGNDVWEHAYYLKYQNRRPEYLKAWWNVVNWDVVTKRYKEHMG